MIRHDDPAATVRAYLASRREPTPAETAAEVLGDYGFTDDDIEQGLAEGGTISVRTSIPGPCSTEASTP